MADPVLVVRDLTVTLPAQPHAVTVVDQVSYKVDRGQIFGIAGESGSGKSLSVLALLGLLPSGARVQGEALFRGGDLLVTPQAELRAIRGRRIGLVLQDPMASLHPMLTVGRLLTEHVRAHLGLDQRGAEQRALDLLRLVRIPDPVGSMKAHPHHFSGGMRQRIAIAIAMACGPELIIADEPTTALDVTVQAGILRLFKNLCDETGTSFILISHDLAVLATITEQVMIMYAGRTVEIGSTTNVLGSPRHPYTSSLLMALPRGDTETLVPIPGMPATPLNRPSGCAFNPRCAFAVPTCREEVPLLSVVGREHEVACPVDPLAAIS